MTTPHRRRWRRRPALVAAGTALATVLATVPVTPATAAPAADLPPQEPGVTLRSYDMGTPLSALCTLKAAQTPNVDKLMPQVNWTSTDDFGLADRFISHVTANLAAPVDGTYGFRLTSDDGSRLTIGDTVVVDHDGLHGETAKEGSATLTAGLHPLRIAHFDDGGGQVLAARMAATGRRRLHPRPELRVEHRRRGGPGHRAGLEVLRGGHRLGRRRPATRPGAPRLHPHRPAPRRIPAAGHRRWLAARRASWS